MAGVNASHGHSKPRSVRIASCGVRSYSFLCLRRRAKEPTSDSSVFTNLLHDLLCQVDRHCEANTLATRPSLC